MTYTITTNTAYKSIEIAFDCKPAAAVREALKDLRFRWNPVRGIWYGFADEQAAREAIDGKPVNKPATASLWERTRTDRLPDYGTENEIRRAIRDTQAAKGWGYDRAAADYFRKHLKKRFPEVKFSVTSGGSGYLNKCDIRITAAPWGCIDDDRRKPCEQLAAVLEYCHKLHAAADADDGDYYADYGAYHDLYGSASIAWDFKELRPTEAQKEDAADFSRRNA